MTKNEAHAILDRIKNDREPMSIFITNQALQRTGDIPDLPHNPLRINGDESSNDRAIEMESKRTEKGFSYSAYLDSPKNTGDEK